MSSSFQLIRRTALLGASALVLSTISGFAQLQTESFTTQIPLSYLSSSNSFTLPEFDSSLGMLQSVQLTLAAGGNSAFTIFNTGDNSQSFINIGPSSSKGGTRHLSGAGFATSSVIYTPQGHHAGPATNTTGQGSLFAFENRPNGLVSLSFDQNLPGTTRGRGHSYNSLTQGSGDVTVSYTFAPSSVPPATPEPSSLYLSFVAVFAMALLVMRQRMGQSA